MYITDALLSAGPSYPFRTETKRVEQDIPTYERSELLFSCCLSMQEQRDLAVGSLRGGFGQWSRV